MEILIINGLFRSYEKSKDSVLRGVDLSVRDGEFLGIIGRSGCGKTTLLKILGMIDQPSSGNFFFKGKNTKGLCADELADIRRREVGFIFQDFYLMDSLTIQENIMLPMILDKVDAEVCLQNMQELAERFGIAGLIDKRPYQLSGGEKQRVSICRALINNPDLVLADEPTGNLDSKSGKIVVQALRQINEEMKKTIVMVTHDPQMASNCSRIIFLKDGMIRDDISRTGGREEFYDEILKRMGEL